MRGMPVKEGYHTQKVGLKKANSWGLHDMHDNVWEWVQDLYASTLLEGQEPCKEFISMLSIRSV